MKISTKWLVRQYQFTVTHAIVWVIAAWSIAWESDSAILIFHSIARVKTHLLMDPHDSNLAITITTIIMSKLIKSLIIHLISAIIIIPVKPFSLQPLDFKWDHFQSYYCQTTTIIKVTVTALQCTSASLHSYATLITFDIAIQLEIAIRIIKMIRLHIIHY